MDNSATVNLAEYQKQIADLKAQLEAAQTAGTGYQTQLGDYKSQLEAAQKAGAGYQTQLGDLQTQLDAAKKAGEGYKTQAGDLQAQIDAQKQQQQRTSSNDFINVLRTLVSPQMQNVSQPVAAPPPVQPTQFDPFYSGFNAMQAQPTAAQGQLTNDLTGRFTGGVGYNTPFAGFGYANAYKPPVKDGTTP